MKYRQKAAAVALSLTVLLGATAESCGNDGVDCSGSQCGKPFKDGTDKEKDKEPAGNKEKCKWSGGERSDCQG